jgi:MAP3K TRAFs-binding domain
MTSTARTAESQSGTTTPTAQRPLCFVLMPFGQKSSAGGKTIDFDAVYKELIAPAIDRSGLEPLRADEEMTGGVIHKPMFERLILCEFAVADLTTANANVFYELGVRHSVRPWSTILLFAEGGTQLPFDVAPLRAIPYRLNPEGRPADPGAVIPLIAQRLTQARQADTDSPIFQLVEGFPDIQRLKTDVFRERVAYSNRIKERLAAARRRDLDAVRAVETELGDVASQESGVVIDLFLSYRAVKAWEAMIDLASRMPPPLSATVLVQEQLALALNRAGRGEEAERILTDLLQKRGPSSETYGILGRVYKDRWEAAAKAGHRDPGLSARLRIGLARRLPRRERRDADGIEGAAGSEGQGADPGGRLRGRAADGPRHARLLGSCDAPGTRRPGQRRGARQAVPGGRARLRPRGLGTRDDGTQSPPDPRGPADPSTAVTVDRRDRDGPPEDTIAQRAGRNSRSSGRGTDDETAGRQAQRGRDRLTS